MAPGQKGVPFAVVALALAGFVVLVPLWPPLVLAAWIADLVRPAVRRLERALGGRRAAAGALLVLTVLAVGAPLFTGAFVLVARLRELLAESLRAGTLRGALEGLLGAQDSVEAPLLAPGALVELLREHGAAIGRVVANVWAASVSVLVGLAVFVVALYALTVDGRRLYARLARGVPLDPVARRRLVRAFRDTGRGLLVGTGGTALAQGTLATATYAALGVHNPLTLGLLTGLGSVVPGVGTALVWGPVAVALAIAGHPMRAAILVALGVAVIGTIDNLLRPWLARLGNIGLSAAAVFVSMMGGWRLVGGWGLILGPLLVRLGAEALMIATARRRAAPSRSGAPA
jgi:predicted PurR-regulated permease PerM